MNIPAACQLEFNRKSFNAVEKKFEAGLVDVTDYSAAQQIFRAETETLRTKLQLMIQILRSSFILQENIENLINNYN